MTHDVVMQGYPPSSVERFPVELSSWLDKREEDEEGVDDPYDAAQSECRSD